VNEDSVCEGGAVTSVSQQEDAERWQGATEHNEIVDHNVIVPCADRRQDGKHFHSRTYNRTAEVSAGV